jgi:hypothetical protein
MRKNFLVLLLALFIAASGFTAGVIGFNAETGNWENPAMAGKTAYGCSDWTDSAGAAGTGLTMTGTDGAVTVDWYSAGIFHSGDENTPEVQLYRAYFDDGEPVTVTFYGLADWAAANNAHGYTIRIYQNTDWNDMTYASIDVTDGTDVLETVQAPIENYNYSVPGTYAFVDTAIWNTNTLSLNLSPRDLGRNIRSTFAAAIITPIDRYIPINASPEDGTEVEINPTLSWQQDSYVADSGITYNVYFGTDPNETSATYYGGTPVKVTTADPADFNYVPGTLENSGTYYWRVDAVDGAVVHPSAEMMFTTVPASPRIDSGPTSVTVAYGAEEAQLSVVGINIETYQWYKDGVALADDATDTLYVGEDTNTLTIFDVTVADEGMYYCTGDNSLQQPATSAVAQVLTERVVGWWKFDGDLADSVNELYPEAAYFDGTSGDPNGDPNYVGIGMDGGAVELFGVAEDVITMTGSADFYNFFTRGYSANVWVNIPHLPDGRWRSFVSKEFVPEGGTTSGYMMSIDGSGLFVHTLRQSFNDLFSGVVIDDSTWHMVTMTYDASTGVGCAYVDGVLRAQATNGAALLPNVQDLMLGMEHMASTDFFAGKLDDLRFWSYSIDAYDVAHIYTDFNPGTEVCVENPALDVAGPDGVGGDYVDCKVNIYDFAAIAQAWLECNIVPTCL